MNACNVNLIFFATEKNSIAKRDITLKKPAKSPKAFQEPKILSVFTPKTPKDKNSGKNKRRPWKINTKIDEAITPKKTILTFFVSFKTIEETNIKRNAKNIK